MMTLDKPQRSPLQWLDFILFSLACLAGLLILVLQLAEIGARMLGSSIVFASESTAFLMAVMVFLALPEVTRRSEHITADFLVIIMGPRLRRLVEAFVAPLAMLIYCVLLVWLLYGLASSSLTDSVRSGGSLRLLLFIPQSILLIGAIVTVVRLTLMLAEARGGAAAGDV